MSSVIPEHFHSAILNYKRSIIFTLFFQRRKPEYYQDNPTAWMISP